MRMKLVNILTISRNILSVSIFVLGIVWIWTVKENHWFKDFIEPITLVVGPMIVLCQFLMELCGDKTSSNTTQTALETEMATLASYDVTIKDYLFKRYNKRLNQKLAGRQPVNLRRRPTTEGTSKETSAAFVAFSPDEIKEHIEKTFHDAVGRLLITGVPGAGKTTLLLQLALALLKSTTDGLPVILNLATWKNDYTTLETWLKEILPAELGVSKRLAADMLAQNRLILLFDGFDEIKEDSRASCLAALGRYGAEAKRQFAITSRIEEYKQVAKDAPVYLQIEVGTLTIKQIEIELTRIGHTQPEAKPLLWAIQQDAVLRKAIQVPFYFNSLQLLFANGKNCLI